VSLAYARLGLEQRSHWPNTRLYHFSDEAEIGSFIPRPVRVPWQRAAGMDWLNGPLVWAIEEAFDFLYYFPRDCPRILIWATEKTSAVERAKWLGAHRAAAYVERRWLSVLSDATIYRYAMPTGSFEALDDAGMWISRTRVEPLGRTTMTDLPASFEPRGVDLRVVESLVPLKHLWNTSLHTSGIRLRNAQGWA
jgi:hypothetical protein